jgi:hypothetical protein
MTTLIALVSSGKGTFGYINKLVQKENWDKIILICNDFSYEKFSLNKQNVIKLKYDENNLENSFSKISNVLKNEVIDLEVALNLFSGNGNEHMALIWAVLRAGLGPHFVYLKDDELKEFEILERPEGFENEK